MDALRILTEDGVSLEGEIRMPDATPVAASVLCHPDPMQGGSKDHPLLWAIRIELARRGFAVLSFNHRGVMGSGGSYGGGVGETLDARAAIGAALERVPGLAFVCGWSFGANVALREAVADERVGALALVGLPLAPTGSALPPLPLADLLRGYQVPVMALAGDTDPFCPPDDLRAFGSRLGNATVTIAEGADHYFTKREREAGALVAGFAAAAIADLTG